MEVRLDIGLNEMEAALEDSLEVLLIAGSLLSHHRCKVKRKLSHLEIVLLKCSYHHSIHSIFHWGEDGLVVEVAHQHATHCCCSLELDNPSRFMCKRNLNPSFKRLSISLKLRENQVQCLILVV